MANTVTSSDIHGNQYQVPIKELRWRPSAYAIVIKDGEILLTKQHGAYHLPGGGVELGEMPEDAAIREVKEETGYEVTNPQLVDVLSGFFTMIRTQVERPSHVQSILLYYRCDFAGGEASIDGFDEYERANGEMPEWVPLNQLDTIKPGSTINWRAVVKQVVSK